MPFQLFHALSTQLPVPIFLSLTASSLDPSVRQGVQSCKEEQKMVQDEKYKMKDRPKGTVVTVERQKEEGKIRWCHIWQYLKM